MRTICCKNQTVTGNYLKPQQQLPYGREKILFVDDEKISVEMGRDILESVGYEVTTTTNSLEALEIFSESPQEFDLVITDQRMPHMRGDELSKELLTIRPDLPIILCTAYSTQMNESKAKSMGIREFVLKPLIRKEIAVLIRKVLDV